MALKTNERDVAVFLIGAGTAVGAQFLNKNKTKIKNFVKGKMKKGKR